MPRGKSITLMTIIRKLVLTWQQIESNAANNKTESAAL